MQKCVPVSHPAMAQTFYDLKAVFPHFALGKDMGGKDAGNKMFVELNQN